MSNLAVEEMTAKEPLIHSVPGFDPSEPETPRMAVYHSDLAPGIFVAAGPNLTAQEARTLARFLLTAADQLEGLL